MFKRNVTFRKHTNVTLIKDINITFQQNPRNRNNGIINLKTSENSFIVLRTEVKLSKVEYNAILTLIMLKYNLKILLLHEKCKLSQKIQKEEDRKSVV